VKLVINGEQKVYDGPLTLAALISQMGLKSDRVAVELNLGIVRRDDWARTTLSEGDRLEIVHFVGGGTCTAVSGRSKTQAWAEYPFFDEYR
jgi:thiamine biosynthesis protein ThiS